MIEKQDQAGTVHALAKPVTRAVAWTSCVAATVALAAAAARTLRED